MLYKLICCVYGVSYCTKDVISCGLRKTTKRVRKWPRFLIKKFWFYNSNTRTMNSSVQLITITPFSCEIRFNPKFGGRNQVIMDLALKSEPITTLNLSLSSMIYLHLSVSISPSCFLSLYFTISSSLYLFSPHSLCVPRANKISEML